MSFAKEGWVGKTSPDCGHEILKDLCFPGRRKVQINDLAPQDTLPPDEPGDCKERA